ncbi:mitochondrial amidoxime-reducing component 1 isoform X9 [Vicugna pacos]|uniref:Mitochondrial amidoxime-reducing component 1 isoform X9 n=1 Tax=Vicugna pacos TaxID=30538 RepID=A0ABM5C835_VICPA
MGAAGSSVLARLGLPGRPRPGWLAVAALGLAAVALGAVAWRRARPRRRRRLQQVGTVAQLCIYPIKSCKGVSVSAAECTALGLRSGHLRDRFWMVINKMGNMVTARQEPRLVLISPTCEGDTLTLSAAYTRDLQLPIQTPTTNAVHKCRVHGLEIEGRDCGEAAAQWITSFLKTQPYRLVHFEPHMRPRNSHQIEDVFRPTDQVVYADASPFLILSEASLADLNSRLEKKVKATNFRPNILISGCGVYAEPSTRSPLLSQVWATEWSWMLPQPSSQSTGVTSSTLKVCDSQCYFLAQKPSMALQFSKVPNYPLYHSGPSIILLPCDLPVKAPKLQTGLGI